ncbi:hypothetical protein H8E06_00610 [bacterium]|nr:hypothetical protein [bacterium]
MDVSDKKLKAIRKDIDVLHGLYVAGDSKFSSEKKKFITGARSSDQLIVVDAFLKNLPDSYKTDEYKWLNELAHEIVPRSISLVTPDILNTLTNLRDGLFKRRETYIDNSQWFSSFNKEEKEALESASVYSDQYDEIKAKKPGVVSDLSSLYDTKQKQSITGKFLDWMQGTSGEMDITDVVKGGPGIGFKSGVKTDVIGAWGKLKQSFKKPGAGTSPPAGSRSTTPSSTAPIGSKPRAHKPTEPTQASTEPVPGQTEDRSDESVHVKDDVVPPSNTLSTPAKKTGAPLGATDSHRRGGAILSSPTGTSKINKKDDKLTGTNLADKKKPQDSPRQSGIEKDDKQGVVIRGYMNSGGDVKSLDDLFGGAAAIAARRKGSHSQKGAGAGFGNMLDGDDGSGDSGGGGGFLDNIADLVTRRNRNKKDKPKRKPKRKPRGRKPRGRLGRAGQALKRFGGRALGWGGRLASVATGGMGLGTMLGSSMGAIGTAGAGAIASSAALAAAAGYAGWKVGSWIDKKTGFSDAASDKLAGMGESGQMQKNLDAGNDARKKLSAQTKGKPMKDPKTGRRTQVGWNYHLGQSKLSLDEAKRDHKQSTKHGVWSSDADKKKEKEAKRMLGVRQKSYSNLQRLYKEWQKEGGENWTDPHAGKSPAVKKAAEQKDRLIKLYKSQAHKGTLSQERANIKIAEATAQYKAKIEKIESETKKTLDKKPIKDVNDFAMRSKHAKPGKASRILTGPEGTFRFNKKDDIVAGTDLLGGKKSDVRISNTDKDPIPVKMVKEYVAPESGGLLHKLGLKDLGASLFAGVAGSMRAGMNQSFERAAAGSGSNRMKTAMLAAEGKSVEEDQMAKGVEKGQKKYSTSPEAIGGNSVWGMMASSLGFLTDPKRNKSLDLDYSQTQLVSVGAIKRGLIKAEIDSSEKITSIERSLVSLVTNGINVKNQQAPAPAEKGAQVLPSGNNATANQAAAANSQIINDPVGAIRASQSGLNI